jgi:RNA polymerase sigma-70 factor (ECF subfamily)
MARHVNRLQEIFRAPLTSGGLWRHRRRVLGWSEFSQAWQTRRAESDAVAPQFERIYREHFDFVYRSAARLAGPQIDAEDVAQDVFLVVARRLDTYDGSSLITTWLYGIALNVVRQARRRARTRRILSEAFSLASPGPTYFQLDSVEVREAHRIAYEILDRMPAAKREAFILAEFEALSCEEIAAIVGAKTETIWSRLHYARKEFSERLARYRRRTSDV